MAELARIVPVAGSEKEPRPDVAITGRAAQVQPVQVTIVPRTDWHPAADALRGFAGQYGLELRAEHGLFKLAGTVMQMEAAFGVRLWNAEATNGDRFRSRVGPGEGPQPVMIPAELEPHVLAVLGLDDRPQARPHFRVGDRIDTGEFRPATDKRMSFNPAQFVQLYNLPTNQGSGRKLGILSLGGGYTATDLLAMGVNPNRVHFLGVDGAVNAPTGNPNSADGENDLDLGMQGGMCPQADISFVEAPNTDRGFADGLAALASLGLDAASVSWGAPESAWTAQARGACDQMFQRFRCPVYCASGDGGSRDGTGSPVTDYPAASPYQVGTGGTTVINSNGPQESAWSDSGGGFSKVYARPNWQPSNPSGNGRMVPDVAFDADPATGAVVVVGGGHYVFGGTSMAAPGWAAAWALLVGAGLALSAELHGALYGAASAFHDVTQGSNGDYRCGQGPDPVTGLGSPNGAALLTALQGTPPPPTTASVTRVTVVTTLSDGSSKTVQAWP